MRHDGLRNRWFLDPLYGRGYPADTWQDCGAAVPEVRDGDLAAIAVATVGGYGLTVWVYQMFAGPPGPPSK